MKWNSIETWPNYHAEKILVTNKDRSDFSIAKLVLDSKKKCFINFDFFLPENSSLQWQDVTHWVDLEDLKEFIGNEE